MKTTYLGSLKRLVITSALIAALPAFASKTPQVEGIKKSLSAVPVLEMPAKAAQLVSETSAADRSAMSLAVIQAVSQLKPTAIAPVVGAVVRVIPDEAASIAALATKLQPKQASAITRAAVAAAPSQTGKIVAAVCKQAPKKYDEVATAAIQVAPGAGKEISEAVALTLPERKAEVASIVSLAGPPVVGPPFTSVPGSPTEIGRTNAVLVPPGGGREYSSP